MKRYSKKRFTKKRRGNRKRRSYGSASRYSKLMKGGRRR